MLHKRATSILCNKFHNFFGVVLEICHGLHAISKAEEPEIKIGLKKVLSSSPRH